MIAAEGVSKHFLARGLWRRGSVRALTEVSLAVGVGEGVGLVGESGSGKSTLGRVLLGLVAPSAGRVLVDGMDLAEVTGVARRALRRRMQLVFQDPYSSLDPRRRVGAQVGDGLAIHRIGGVAERAGLVAGLLERVGLPASAAQRHPHEFSGGQRQRLGIARALAPGPDLLVADEPVSALDVSVQAQVLALLADLRTRLGLALLFISHDLPVVRSLCDRVIVLYLGRVMEEGPVAEVFRRPLHPYTQALLSAAPSLDPALRRTRVLLRGEPPSPAAPPSGCVFRTRCPIAVAACADEVPGLEAHGAQRVACIRVGEG